jgi:hypothetical protein
MAESYSKRIRDYCECNGIDVPSGFRRHPASRYAVVDTSKVPPRLIATTWFKHADLLYYLQRHPEPESLRLLDFKDGQELALRGSDLKATGQPL